MPFILMDKSVKVLFYMSSDKIQYSKQLGHKLTTLLHLVLRLRIHGAIPPISHAPSWRGT
jgi:hypothetical protein